LQVNNRDMAYEDNPAQFNAGDALVQGLPAATSAFLGGSAMGSPILGAAMGLGTLGIGLYQKYRASQMPVPKRPVALTPTGISENVFNARNVASGALGNATNTLAQQQLNQGTARGIMASREGARSGTDLLASVGGLNQNQNNAQNNLAQQNYQQRLGGFGMLANANQANAGYDDRNFNYNQVQPYNQAYQNVLNASAAGNANLNTARQEGMGMFNQAAALAPYGIGNFGKMFGGFGQQQQSNYANSVPTNFGGGMSYPSAAPQYNPYDQNGVSGGMGNMRNNPLFIPE
jgi:hypothetical protein